MLGVVLVDLGLAIVLSGAIGLIHPLARLGMPTRARAAAVALAGALVAAAGLLLPAPERQAPSTVSLLDEIMPRWQFAEHHETRVHAAPAVVERAIREVTAREIALFRVLTWLRSPRLPGSRHPESILTPPADRPILAVALRSGFMVVGEDAGRELVLGTIVAAPPEVLRLPSTERERWRSRLADGGFRTLAEPGFAKAAMSFRWTDEGGGWTRLVTETRVAATDTATRRRFAIYWRIIYPGSSWIRHAWLAAIKKRAEGAGMAR